MTPKHDYLESSYWYKEKIADPYQTVAEFFSYADIAFYRKSIKVVVKTACSYRVWSKKAPGHLLFEFRMLESIINAAYLINQEKKKSPLRITSRDVFNTDLYCGRRKKLTEWDYFPRFLSMKEYIDPYLVFKNFFKCQDIKKWKQDLFDILECALSDMSLFETELNRDILSIYFHLTKLVEAAHLIDVREITHIGGHIKSRF